MGDYTYIDNSDNNQLKLTNTINKQTKKSSLEIIWRKHFQAQIDGISLAQNLPLRTNSRVALM